MSERDPSTPKQPAQLEDYTAIPVPGEYRPEPEVPQGDTGTFQIPNPPRFEATRQSSRNAGQEQYSGAPDEEKGNPNRFIKSVYKLTGALALAGVVVFGGQKVLANSDGPEQREGTRSAATGEAVPGQESQPQQETGDGASTETGTFSPEKKYTDEEIEFGVKNSEGEIVKVVKGVEAYKKHMQLSTTEFPEEEDAIRALPERFNAFILSGLTPQEQDEYNEYESPDSPVTGAAGVQLDIVTPAFTEALLRTPEPEENVWQSGGRAPTELISGSDLESNYFCLDRVATRANIAFQEDSSRRPKLVLDTNEGFRDSGIQTHPGTVGHTATLYLKPEGFEDASEGVTFKTQVTLLKSPDGSKWDIVSAFTVPPTDFYKK